MYIRIIIPVLNEANNLQRLLPHLKKELAGRGDIIVADGGSTDDSAEVTASHSLHFFKVPRPGRASQMNAAATAFPHCDAFYFVHADTIPPTGFYQDIVTSINQGFPVGCYRFAFDSKHPLLAINAYFTRFNNLACRGGDQSLYVQADVFQSLGGFKPEMYIMEDYDFIERAQATFPFRIIPRNIIVSARKYQANNYLKVQLANLKVFRMYRRGASQESLLSTYKRMLNKW